MNRSDTKAYPSELTSSDKLVPAEKAPSQVLNEERMDGWMDGQVG